MASSAWAGLVSCGGGKENQGVGERDWPRPIGPPGREQVALLLFFLFYFPNNFFPREFWARQLKI